MKKQLFSDAIQNWQEHYVSDEMLWPHMADKELLSLRTEISAKQRNDIIKHLSMCKLCAERFTELVEPEIQETVPAMTVCYKKAAAVEKKTYPIVIFSQDRVYKLTIRKSLDSSNEGLINLSIIDPKSKDQLEQHIISVYDANKRLLLKGKVINSEISYEIDDVDSIVDSNILIIPKQ